METRNVFCPRCDHEVTLTLTPTPLHGRGQATLPDGGELVCLDFGRQCSGRTCAISSLPRVVMGVRLARSGLRPEQLDTVRALCEGCDRVQDLQIVDDTHARCPACDTISLWSMVRLDGEEWLAVTGRRAEVELG
ncbi:MAG TPA: hypothetical protein VMM12_04170 [Longimicrobiales bacterium]|nr:hypothetical protein [Longimicrobiales bacterium]